VKVKAPQVASWPASWIMEKLLNSAVIQGQFRTVHNRHNPSAVFARLTLSLQMGMEKQKAELTFNTI